MKKINTLLNKKILLFTTITVVILSVALITYNKVGTKTSVVSEQTPSEQEKLNLDPPTEEDAKRVEANKEKNINRDEQINNQPIQEPGSKKSVVPTITYSGLYGSVVEVGGFVSNIFEDGGTCTATFTRDSTSFNKTVTAVKNINSVDCPVMSAQKSEFNQIGKWYVTVSYDSSTANGKSEVREIEIK